MVNCTPLLFKLFIGGMCFLTLAIMLCLVRAALGPRFTDRVVALNVICTLVIMLVCMLSYLLQAAYLIDVAILYGLINLLAVALLSRLTIRHHRRKKGG